MDKEKWQSMTDEEKTMFMRKAFKSMSIGDSFDYAECRKVYEMMKEAGLSAYSVYENPCIVLELVDPIMTFCLTDWMFYYFDDKGEKADRYSGITAPLFGYNMVELYLNKGSLMNFSDSEKQVLREAMRIIGEKTKEENL